MSFIFASRARARAASGSHEFDQLCTELGTELGIELGIEHRLTPPKSPQSETDQETVRETVSPANGMVKRFNGHMSDVLKTNRFDSAFNLKQTLMRYVHLYNTQLGQLRLKFQVQHPAPSGHRMLRWTNDTSTSTARNVA